MANEIMIDNKLCCCIIMLLIIILFTESIINHPIIKNLFIDSINYILLISLVIFTILLDLKCGIIFALAVLYISMNITLKSKISIINHNNNSNTSNNTISNLNNKLDNTNDINDNTNDINDNTNDINDNTNDINDNTNDINNNTNDINNNISNNSKRSVTFNENENIINLAKDNSIRSESEFIYDNTKPFPNNNIKPFDNNAENSNAIVFTNEYNNENNVNELNGQPDRSGFDVSGCRYDMQNSPQNLTKNGPPLAQCSVYDINKFKSCGTLFYPLNA